MFPASSASLLYRVFIRFHASDIRRSYFEIWINQRSIFIRFLILILNLLHTIIMESNFRFFVFGILLLYVSLGSGEVQTTVHQDTFPTTSPASSRTGVLASYPGFFSPLSLLLIVPLLLLFLAFIFGGGNSYGGYYARASSRSAPGFSPYLSTMEMVRLAKKVLAAIENDSCRRRSVCEMGVYIKSFGATKDLLIGTLENLAPQNMQPYVALVKESANSNNTEQFCNLFQCKEDSSPSPPSEKTFQVPSGGFPTNPDHVNSFIKYG